MNHRERVVAALNHQEPDRVPIDLGGTDVSSIMTDPYLRLRRRLGIGPGKTRVADVSQQIVMTEEDVRQAFDADIAFVYHEPRVWKEARLADGSSVEVPAKFQPVTQANGSQVVFDRAGVAVLRMPPGGFYFDPVYSPLANAAGVEDIDSCMSYLEELDKPSYLDKSYEELAVIAKELHEHTDYLVVGYFGGHIFQAGQFLRGWELFLQDLILNRAFAEALMDKLVEVNIKRFKCFAETVGKYVQVVEVQDDLGMQDRPLIDPKMYRTLVKPYHQRLYSFVKSQCQAKLVLHTDGAVATFIPDFIELGVDALNPIQVSAAGMDTKVLKKEYGKDIAFWGAGCDNRSILQFGKPQEVANEVKRRIDDLAPGGGFVFGPIHNIQTGVPSENIVALYETARQYGVY